MRLIRLLLMIPLVAGCITANPSAKGVTIALEKAVTTDAMGVVHTEATLVFSGAVNERLDLGEITGELLPVNPETYDDHTVLILTAWFAGGGREITVFQDPDSIGVQSIEGGEEGVCTEAETLADYPLTGDTTIMLEGLGGDMADQSSLAFCHQS